MQSNKTSNGSAQQDGRLSGPLTPSKTTTRPRTSLGFATSRDPVNIKRDQHLGRHERWDAGREYERVVYWQRVAGKNNQPSEHRILGILVSTAMTILCGFMAYTTLTNESKLLKMESSVDRPR